MPAERQLGCRMLVGGPIEAAGGSQDQMLWLGCLPVGVLEQKLSPGRISEGA